MRFDIGLGMFSRRGSGYQKSISSLLTTTTTYPVHPSERRHRDGVAEGLPRLGSSAPATSAAANDGLSAFGPDAADDRLVHLFLRSGNFSRRTGQITDRFLYVKEIVQSQS
jgi:hypothetical protein